MLRFFDILISLATLILGFPLLLIVYIVSLFFIQKPIFFQTRVGRYKKPFVLIKFRTMPINTASVASHLVNPSVITPFGIFLRRTKLDELPQLWNVLMGEMSLVGPRPCLFNQFELIHEREIRDIYDMRPGITGLAQISGIDMSTPKLLAETELCMLSNLSISTYFQYIYLTLSGRGMGDGVGK